MTAKRRDNHSTEFGLWLREQDEVDSGRGYIATNLDYIWHNYRSGKWMLIEEKRYGAKIARWQRDMFNTLHRAAKGDKNYCGMHLVVFENTCPEDGRIWLNNVEITKEQLILFLQFEKYC